MKKEIDSTELYKDLWDAIDIFPYCDSPKCRNYDCHIHKPKAWQTIMKVLERHGIKDERI